MGIYLTTGSASFVGLPWWDDTIIWHISHLPLDSKAGSKSALGRTVLRHLTFGCTTLWLKNQQYIVSINHTLTTLRAGWQISTSNCQWWIICRWECFKQGSLGSCLRPDTFQHFHRWEADANLSAVTVHKWQRDSKWWIMRSTGQPCKAVLYSSVSKARLNGILLQKVVPGIRNSRQAPRVLWLESRGSGRGFGAHDSTWTNSIKLWREVMDIPLGIMRKQVVYTCDPCW